MATCTAHFFNVLTGVRHVHTIDYAKGALPGRPALEPYVGWWSEGSGSLDCNRFSMFETGDTHDWSFVPESLNLVVIESLEFDGRKVYAETVPQFDEADLDLCRMADLLLQFLNTCLDEEPHKLDAILKEVEAVRGRLTHARILPVVDIAIEAANKQRKGEFYSKSEHGGEIPSVVCEHYTNFFCEEVSAYMDSEYADRFKRVTL